MGVEAGAAPDQVRATPKPCWALGPVAAQGWPATINATALLSLLSSSRATWQAQPPGQSGASVTLSAPSAQGTHTLLCGRACCTRYSTPGCSQAQRPPEAPQCCTLVACCTHSCRQSKKASEDVAALKGKLDSLQADRARNQVRPRAAGTARHAWAGRCVLCAAACTCSASSAWHAA